MKNEKLSNQELREVWGLDLPQENSQTAMVARNQNMALSQVESRQNVEVLHPTVLPYNPNKSELSPQLKAIKSAVIWFLTGLIILALVGAFFYVLSFFLTSVAEFLKSLNILLESLVGTLTNAVFVLGGLLLLFALVRVLMLSKITQTTYESYDNGGGNYQSPQAVNNGNVTVNLNINGNQTRYDNN